jgi:hypothetical protein
MSEFIPKGGMCAVCEHRDEDCSAIEFKHCLVIEIDHSEDVKVVKCGDFEREAGPACESNCGLCSNR